MNTEVTSDVEASIYRSYIQQTSSLGLMDCHHAMDSPTHVLSSTSGHLLSLVPPFGITYALMFAIPSARLSFALNQKLTSCALRMDTNDRPASICTSKF